MKSFFSFVGAVCFLGFAAWLFFMELHNLHNAEIWSPIGVGRKRSTIQRATNVLNNTAVVNVIPATTMDSDEARARLEQILNSSPRGPGGIPLPKMEQLFVDFPSVKEAYLESVRANRKLLYARYFATAQMSSSDIEKFCDIIVARERTWADLAIAAQKDGLPGLTGPYKELDKAAN